MVKLTKGAYETFVLHDKEPLPFSSDIVFSFGIVHSKLFIYDFPGEMIDPRVSQPTLWKK